MIQDGFLEEVEKLMKEGLLTNTSASQAIGYRQAIEYLQSKQTKEDFEKFVESFKKASRHYAKRQFTWFRREPIFKWLDLEAHDTEVALEIVKQEYEARL